MDFSTAEPKRPDPKAAPSEKAKGGLGDVVIPKKYIVGGLGLIVLAVLTFSGLLSRGYESRTISFSGVSKSSAGSSFGAKRMFLRKGQTFVIDYETQSGSGGLFIRLAKLWKPTSPNVGAVRVEPSESGTLRVEIPDTDVYALRIHGSPGGRDGYHITYTVRWSTE